MNTFLIFHFDVYYPSGGAADLVATASSLEEAKAISDRLSDDESKHDWKRADIQQVLDTTTGLIYRKSNSPRQTDWQSYQKEVKT